MVNFQLFSIHHARIHCYTSCVHEQAYTNTCPHAATHTWSGIFSTVNVLLDQLAQAFAFGLHASSRRSRQIDTYILHSLVLSAPCLVLLRCTKVGTVLVMSFGLSVIVLCCMQSYRNCCNADADIVVCTNTGVGHI